MSTRAVVELLPLTGAGQGYLQLLIDLGDDEELTYSKVETVLQDALEALRSGGFMLRSRRELPENLNLQDMSDRRPMP